MNDLEARAILLNAKAGRTDYEAFDIAEQAILKLDKIKTITERALRSSDPINLYKALCINEIAEILGVKAPDPARQRAKVKSQLTIYFKEVYLWILFYFSDLSALVVLSSESSV